MGKSYNTPYKKGIYLSSHKAMLADKAKLSKKVYPNNSAGRKLWLKDTRKYDLFGVDTPPTKGQKVFKYTHRSGKRLGKKPFRENKSWRRYWY